MISKTKPRMLVLLDMKREDVFWIRTGRTLVMNAIKDLNQGQSNCALYVVKDTELGFIIVKDQPQQILCIPDHDVDQLLSGEVLNYAFDFDTLLMRLLVRVSPDRGIQLLDEGVFSRAHE